MKTVRIWFRKTDTAKYISHLDLNRCMSRAMRRAAIPAWVTEGFNPHLFLTFALPLPLGQEGLSETMDIKLPDDYAPDTLPEQLNRVLPAGLIVTRAAEAVRKPSQIASADYEITVAAEQLSPEALTAQLTDFLAQEHIPVIKRGKAGDRTLDLKPMLGAAVPEQRPDGAVLHLTLPAGSAENINPMLLLDAFAAGCDAERTVRITRTAVYDAEHKIFA